MLKVIKCSKRNLKCTLIKSMNYFSKKIITNNKFDCPEQGNQLKRASFTADFGHQGSEGFSNSPTRRIQQGFISVC